MKGLTQLLETGEPNVVISRRGSKVLSSQPKSIPGVYIYLVE
jgi:hypothetical protein